MCEATKCNVTRSKEVQNNSFDYYPILITFRNRCISSYIFAFLILCNYHKFIHSPKYVSSDLTWYFHINAVMMRIVCSTKLQWISTSHTSRRFQRSRFIRTRMCWKRIGTIRCDTQSAVATWNVMNVSV